jgi:hypothetical protein
MSDLFDWRGTYPNQPGHRRTATSKAGADAVREKAPILRDQALAYIKRMDMWGATADECAEFIEKSVLAIRPRVTELSRLGKIYDAGVTRKNKSGVSAIVWRAY